MNIKWIFFDVGYTLVNEDKAHEDRIKRTIEKNKNYTYKDIYNLMIKASKEYMSPYSTAIEALGIKEKEAYSSELDIPYDSAKRVLSTLHKEYKIGIIANQKEGTANRLKGCG